MSPTPEELVQVQRVAQVVAVMTENDRAVMLAAIVMLDAAEKGCQPRELLAALAESEQWADVEAWKTEAPAITRAARNARALYSFIGFHLNRRVNVG